jgi:hypothetical protein
MGLCHSCGVEHLGKCPKSIWGNHMRKMDKVICNKARESCCCIHSIPHDVWRYRPALKCTAWGSCFKFPEGQDTAVRCTKVKEVTAQKEGV